MMAPGMNLVMTVIGFTVSTMFIVFVCTRLICARIHYLSSRRSFRLSSRSDLNSLERGLRGVEPLVVANFPTKKYGDPFFACARDAQCTVCLSDYHAEDTLRILPFCGHFFHLTCIDIWLQQHCTCPVCRVSFRELSERRQPLRPVSSSAIRYSSGAQDNHRMDPTSESRFQSTENDPEAGQNNSMSNEGNPVTKDSENKQVESPSNA